MAERMSPPPADEDDEPELSREVIRAQKRAERAAALRAARESKTRRSWYTSTSAADAFTAVVDDIHHATRIPKHEVVAALMEVAVERREQVEKRLARGARVRPMR
jgi:hypothetical protein